MGRELRRKEERKNKNKVAKTKEELDTSIHGSTIAKIVVFTILILLVLYYIVAVFITKEINVSWTKNETSTDTSTTSQVSDRILAKNTFNQKEETYYVYFYDFNDEDQSISSAISSRSDLKIYRVDTSSALNQNYVTEESGNRNVTSVSDLKVKNPTIIAITNDGVTAYYEGSSEILSLLN